MSLHPSASQGFARGADRYVIGRPDYPVEVAGWLAGAIGLRAGRTAVDLGAGTGKFTPYLLATDARVIAVEPVAAMRDQLARRLPEVEVLAGTAEALPLAEASVDAVICAQAFHWFATTKALAEIARVMRPGGMLGLIWNQRDKRVPWVKALSAIMSPHEGDAPRHADGAWRAVFPAAGFGPLAEQRWGHAHRGPAERVIVDRTLSTSFIAALPDAARELVASQVRALIAATPELADQAEVSFPYETVAFACEKMPGG